ncbi:unnamed protein product, partial [Adineta steineri]
MLGQFCPMILKQEYDDIIYLLKYSEDTNIQKYSEDTNIQLFIKQVFQNVLEQKSCDKDKLRDAIKFIGTL